MPLYVYHCQNCGETHEALVKIDRRHDAPYCVCGGETRLLVSQTARPKFGFGVRGHYSKEANTVVRPSVRGSNDGYEG